MHFESIMLEQGLDFILSHFTEPIWPRNIATAATQTKQHAVEDKQRALLYFNSALRQDCRLAIYPNYEKIQEKISSTKVDANPKPIPNHLFIELDLKDFRNREELDAALKSTIRRIKRELNDDAIPTVLWSGGGYHIHQPLDITDSFENQEEFKKYENVSVKFLRYAARRLSAGKSDPNHNISFRSCLCRVPGSVNSKYEDKEVAQVKIVQRWNGARAKPTSEFITEFLIALTQKKIEENINKWKNPIIHNSTAIAITNTAWIERLIQTPIADYRKAHEI